METILIANEKGGAGKSSTCLCLGNCLTAMGYKVLIIDTDPSGNLSAAALPENPELVLYDVIENRTPLKSVIRKTNFCDILPTIKDEDDAESAADSEITLDDLAPRKNLGDAFDRLKALSNKKRTEQILALLIRANKLEEIYDFILIDTPPAANFIVTCGIVAADTLIIPAEPNAASADGIKMIMASVREAQAKYNTDINIDGMVFARYSDDSATRRAHTKLILEMAESMEIPIYNTRFWISPPVEQSMNDNVPILDYPNGRGLSDAMAFTLEFLEKRGLEPKVIYPGILTDENNKWIFRKNGSVYYTYTSADGIAQVEEKRFRLEHLNDEFKEQIGKTVFFSKDNLLGHLAQQGIPVADDADINPPC